MPESLLLLLAPAPLVIALVVAGAPVRPARVAGFATRHSLLLTPAGEAAVTGYLAVTRRWRSYGVACAYLVTALSMLPEGQVGFSVLPLLAGWMGGALIAEGRFRAVSGRPGGGPATVAVTPGWIVRVPWVLAAAAVAGTAAGLAWNTSTGGTERILAFGLGALVCAMVVALSNRHVAGVRAGAEPDDADRAIAANAIGAITAVGTVIVLSCLVMVLQTAGGGLFGARLTAVGGVGLLWSVGAASLGLGISAAARLVWDPPRREHDRVLGPTRVLAVLAVLLLGSATWAGYAWWRDHPPYGPDAVTATATILLTDEGGFAADARTLGVTDLNPILAAAGDQAFAGRLDLALPPDTQDEGLYHLVVIDQRTGTLAPMLFSRDGGGWDGFLGGVPKQYPWLSAMADVRENGGWTEPGSEISFAPGGSEPVVFVGMFRDANGLRLSDLRVALIFSGPDQQIYWAVPVPLTPAR